jgi:hypothetical protein
VSEVYDVWLIAKTPMPSGLERYHKEDVHSLSFYFGLWIRAFVGRQAQSADFETWQLWIAIEPSDAATAVPQTNSMLSETLL